MTLICGNSRMPLLKVFTYSDAICPSAVSKSPSGPAVTPFCSVIPVPFSRLPLIPFPTLTQKGIPS